MAARIIVGKVITATPTHKPARLIFAMLMKGGEYVEHSQKQYKNKIHKSTVVYLKRKATVLGFTMQPIDAV